MGIRQATFGVTYNDPAELWVKHLDLVTVDVEAINTALAKAGDVHVVR